MLEVSSSSAGSFEVEGSYTTPVVKSSKMNYVSQFGTIMNLINSLMGAGILSVPNSFTFCGFFPTFILMTAIAALSYCSACLIVKLQLTSQAASFSDKAEMTMGKIGSVLLSICVSLFCYSSMVAYLIIGSDILISFFKLGGITMPDVWGRPVLVLVFSFVCPILMTVPKKLNILSAISTIAVFGLFLFFFSMIYKGIDHFFIKKETVHPTVELYEISLGFFNALGVHSLSFAMVVILLPIIMPSHPNIRKRYFSVGASFFVCYALVMIPGVIGYLMFGATTEPVILDSFSEKDVLMIIVRAGYFVILSASYPVIGVSLISTFGKAIFKVDNMLDLNWRQRFVCLLFENVPTLLVSIFIPNVRPILAIGGAIGGCMTNFFFPGVFALRLTQKKLYHWKNILCFALAGFGVVTTVISTYEGVIDAIKSIKEN
ncbi:Transmembrane amino acid transporter protein [Tritrichomonas foetus]|uniref:Transmembrane amino acid transporter protein n=1 Tax=Tritrichomonas foetus TaxID=1144522 RepID=A0A1J4K5D9_9EUKA|nr:Transmembrane amino acid transporter protein [Tritrichomonas foetus]|eukprot:OHT06210.1 Transmembrane amino acid transporter protein [Tritrichomonas foetus]